MNPGATINPLASKTSKPLELAIFPAGANSAIFSPFKSTSNAPSVFRVGSMTRPFLTRSMRRILYVCRSPVTRLRHVVRRMRAFFAETRNQKKQQRHPYRNPIADLLQDAGLWAVRHLRGNFDSPIHGSRVQHDGVRFRQFQSLR